MTVFRHYQSQCSNSTSNHGVSVVSKRPCANNVFLHTLICLLVAFTACVVSSVDSTRRGMGRLATPNTKQDSNLHNTSHNEGPRSRLLFSTCFDDDFRGNNGDIPYDAAHVVNCRMARARLNDMRERNGLRSPPDYAGLNGRRAAGAKGATICGD